MASSGKKGKKTKGKTLALNDFLQETTGSTPSLPLRKTNLNWADDVEEPLEYETRPKINVVLPTAPKASRGVDEYNERIPKEPPYIAYLTNLPYDVDEEEIESLFSHLKIANTRFPKEDRASDLPRLKGYGYIEFEDRDSLTSALSMPDCILKNRRIRIEVATSLDNDRQRRGRNDMNRDRIERGDTGGDWRSGPRGSEFSDFSRDREGGFNRDRDGGGGFHRDRESSGFTRDREGGFNRDREGGFNRDRDGGSTREREGGSWRESSDRPSNRGFNREGFGDRGRFGGDRDGEKRGGFSQRRGDRDDKDGFSRSKDEEKAEPRIRPKLMLAPRTKPIAATDAEDTNQKQQQTENADSNVPSVPTAASIFGAARPVDTAAREREIESKLAKEHDEPTRDSSRERGRDDTSLTTTSRREWSTGGGVRRGSPRRGSTERRRYSPRRRTSPRRYSPRGRGSPARYRRGSPKRRSPGGYYSPRRGSPVGRRYSPASRRSPARHSPKRRDSPGRYSPRRRDSQGRYSPRRKDSPRRYSPRRRDSPERYSPRRRDSPEQTSTKRITSPGGRYSPRRRDSPSPTNRGKNLSGHRTPQRDISPERYSPRRSLSSSPSRVRPVRSEDEDNGNRNRARRSGDGSSSSVASSPEGRRQFSSRANEDVPSLNEKNGSAAGYGKRESEGGRRRRNSPPPKEKSQQASDKRKGSKKSPDRSKRTDKSSNDNKKHADDKKNATKDKIRKEKREPHEMPKLKEPEPPNFAVSNKYAFLAECADDVDVSD